MIFHITKKFNDFFLIKKKRHKIREEIKNQTNISLKKEVIQIYIQVYLLQRVSKSKRRRRRRGKRERRCQNLRARELQKKKKMNG